MRTFSALDVLTDDVRAYTLSFTLASTLRCLSMTCRDAKPLTSEAKTLDVLCCEEDDLELFEKLVTEGHLPTERHVELAVESGSLRIFDFLRSTIPSVADATLLTQKMFDKYFACLDTVPLEAVTVELEKDRRRCRDLGVNESNAECWYKHQQFSFAANMYLVESCARLAYRCDVYDTEEMQTAVTKAIAVVSTPTLASVLLSVQAPLVFRTDRAKEVCGVMMNKLENSLAHLFGYGYTGAEYIRRENMYLVSFDVARGNERAIHLYGYKCPVEAYTDSVRDFDLEKLKLFRRHLTPLGIRVEYSLLLL